MLRQAVILVLVGAATANICTTDAGHWSYGIDTGVTDFAHSGVALNKSYYCFEGCLITGTSVQNYKVLLAGPSTKAKERTRKHQDVLQKLKGANPDDPNADTCIDPVLRADVADALNKVTDHSCKGIARALLLNLNRPGWAINCVKFDEFGMDAIYEDMNFCDYDAYLDGEIYNVRLAAIDFS